ncbi:hypothetical protein V7056_18605 [Bacillus sp. JJ664]
MVIIFSTSVIENFEGLKEINRLSVWVVAMISLLIISIFGSFPLSTFLELKHYVINSKGYSTGSAEVQGMELEKTDLKTDIELLLLDI